MARIAIDCDGVLSDFVKAFIDTARQVFPGKLPRGYKPTDWDFSDALTSKDVDKVWGAINKTPNFWLGLDALPGVGDLAQWLVSRHDHDVWVCTSRSPVEGMTTTKQTDIWLQSCGLRGVNNFFGVVTVPQSEHKSDVYQAMEIEWSLDDKPETVIDCGLIDTFEHKAWMLNTPQNQHVSIHNRVDRVSQFLEKIG